MSPGGVVEVSAGRERQEECATLRAGAQALERVGRRGDSIVVDPLAVREVVDEVIKVAP